MSDISVRFLGCGDAFGSGGRLQSCIHVDTGSFRFLLDCGSSVLPAARRLGVALAEIDAILLSHLHGDHFGGVPFVLLEARFVSNRSRELTVAGPPQTRSRIDELCELLFPGTMSPPSPFPLACREYTTLEPFDIGTIRVIPYPAVHQADPPSFSLRVECGGATIAYSGDSEWNDNLIEAARGADLFICESNHYDTSPRNHMSYRTIMQNRDALECRRLVLTHLGPEMLAHADELDTVCAHDGMTITL